MAMVEGEPQGLESIFAYVVSSIGSLYGLVFKPSFTIREWLNEARPRAGSVVYDALRKFGLFYEQLLYDRPREPDMGLARTLYKMIKGLFENEDKVRST